MTRQNCWCRRPGCEYYDPEEWQAQTPDALKPKTGGVTAISIILGVIAVVGVFQFTDRTRSWAHMGMLCLSVFGTIIVIGQIIAYVIREKPGPRAKAILAAIPTIALVVAPFSIWRGFDAESSVNDEKQAQFHRDLTDPHMAAWSYIQEVVSTTDNEPGDYDVNDTDTDGIDSRSYVCAADVDERAREVFRTQGVFPQVREWEASGKYQTAGYGQVSPGDTDSRPNTRKGDDWWIYIEVEAENSVYFQKFFYRVTMHPNGDAWCVNGVEYVATTD
jgi:hypothetical protein